jgi:aryl-alcohol dehydrogenase-like predicted oxidoreductase
MIYKKVKMIEEEISAIGIGCWNFGGDWDSSEEKNSIAVVHKAIELGVNLIDIAPVYGWGESERILGKALKGGLREKVLIASKAGLVWEEKYKPYKNLSKKSILAECDASLKRLGTDYIDIYQMHWPDPATPLEETAEALLELRKAGKIRYFGLSNYAQADVERMIELTGGIHCQQTLYNMLQRNTDDSCHNPLSYRTEREVLPTVKKYGQAYLPFSPLFQGLLAGRFSKGVDISGRDIRNENPKLVGEEAAEYIDAAKQIEKVAADIGHPMNEIAFNWLRQKPEVTSIIGGASSAEQLEKNVKSIEWDIDDETMRRLEAIIEPFKDK